ncbi:Hypothetical protein PHPALM_19181 [Phytophthora palmivora]|uniref:Uncharacterized protein n=1 Tax=Phytophthora palmivora TaxID=4796 RepID=A0A2P4XHZ2_9STRA|nr:Hypothetical protein PHPALM_19181 [Phytophthora palmivora]
MNNWTSLSAACFISFTLHYVDATFNLNKWTLEATRIPGKHDAPSIAAALLRCFLSWNLDRKKCVRFLRDGASNNELERVVMSDAM